MNRTKVIGALLAAAALPIGTIAGSTAAGAATGAKTAHVVAKAGARTAGGGTAGLTAPKVPGRIAPLAHESTAKLPAATRALIASLGKVTPPPARIRRNFKLSGHGAPANTAYSSNWSGYVDTGEKYTYVLGYWTVPQASCSFFEFSDSSMWVGLDGWNDGTVEQLGTDTGCIAGVHLYYAWTEMYPAGEDVIDHLVYPGDVMGAYVSSNASGTGYTMAIEDFTRGWYTGLTAAASPADQDSSAEWIMERPSCWYACSSLTDYGTVEFFGAEAVGNGGAGAISSFPSTPTYMDNGNLEATVSSLFANGTAFLDYWQHG